LGWVRCRLGAMPNGHSAIGASSGEISAYRTHLDPQVGTARPTDRAGSPQTMIVTIARQ
jgi:hypothetical protein